MVVQNFITLLLQSFIGFEGREKYLNVATSLPRAGNRPSPHLWVDFNTHWATCHREEGAKMGSFLFLFISLVFLECCLSTFSERLG